MRASSCFLRWPAEFLRGWNDALRPEGNCRIRRALLRSPRSALRLCNATVCFHGLKPGPERKLSCACRIQESNDRGASLQWLRLETASRATGSAATHNLSRFVPELRGSGTANSRGDPGSDILDGGQPSSQGLMLWTHALSHC
jgi:hypothetical protein